MVDPEKCVLRVNEFITKYDYRQSSERNNFNFKTNEKVFYKYLFIIICY